MGKILLLLLLLAADGCASGSDNNKNDTEIPGDGTTSTYWTDKTVKPGLQVRDNSPAAFYLGNEKYYGTGVNCYDLFLASIQQENGSYTFDASISCEMLRTLKRNGVGVVRFSCGPYYAGDVPAYTDNKREFLATLESVVAYAEKLNIGLVPSIVWQYQAIPNYYGEPTRAWGRVDSRTISYLKNYVEDVVGILSKYKSIFAWEFGNELNLEADLPNWQEAFQTTDPDYWFKGSDLNFALTTFIETVRANDPAVRAVISGHANLRNSQYNQYAHNTWNTDSRSEYRQITEIFTPEGMEMSEHIYEYTRKFTQGDKVVEVDLGSRLDIAMQTAASLGKVYVVGEFGAPDNAGYKNYYNSLLRNGVQLSFVWNFSAYGNIEHSFTEQSELGQLLFGMIRTCNGKYSELYP